MKKFYSPALVLFLITILTQCGGPKGDPPRQAILLLLDAARS